ncbi:MAG: single-stranded-DNA-specific exonuclease RecJ [Patescibacteria group bacterium]
MKKKWRLRPASVENNLNVLSPFLRQLLIQRGLTEQRNVDSFLTPDYERDLHNPFLMLDMERAVERIIKAIKDDERIAVFADYDADGVPGAAVLAAFFKQINFPNFTVYIPDRHEESYGLNNQALAALAQDGVKLIITVDCGVTDVAPVVEANRLGLEVIITDHHLVPEILPDAYAIVNPKRTGDPYPYKMLAGAGVVFKLVQALVREFVSPKSSDLLASGSARPLVQQIPAPFNSGWEKWLLDLVAIATVSDMVPLTGENRALVYFGLKVLRQTRRLGLRRLLDELNLAPEFVTEDDIGFSIGPRLNSASRMSHGHEAYALLTAEDEVEAARLARHLELKNKERRARVDEILNSPRLDNWIDSGETVLVSGNSVWSLGVLGLAAGRLAEKYCRPVFLWGENGRGEIKGSCRSDGTVNIVELMKLAEISAAGSLFLNYGGHAGAGGFSLCHEHLPELADCLQTAYRQLAKFPVTNNESAAAAGECFYDWQLPIEEINHETHALLDQIAPFGLDNPKPVFFLSDLELLSRRNFGNGARHLELVFKHPDLGQIKAVQFFAPLAATEGESLPLAGIRLDLLVNLEKSYFRNRPELRLRIIDWRAAI